MPCSAGTGARSSTRSGGRRSRGSSRPSADFPGIRSGGQHYKRVPAGFDAGHRNAELLKHKGLYAGFEAKIPNEFYSARLVDYCFERFAPLAPLNRWLMRLYG
jgi:hypothetical protein